MQPLQPGYDMDYKAQLNEWGLTAEDNPYKNKVVHDEEASVAPQEVHSETIQQAQDHEKNPQEWLPEQDQAHDQSERSPEPREEKPLKPLKIQRDSRVDTAIIIAIGKQPVPVLTWQIQLEVEERLDPTTRM
jgi:hypothetical protein